MDTSILTFYNTIKLGRYVIKEKCRSDFDQAYHGGNALKLTFMVGSQNDDFWTIY